MTDAGEPFTIGAKMTTKNKTKNLIALGIVVVGVMFLLKNSGILTEQVFGVLWPLVAVVLGGALLLDGDK